MTVKTLLSGMVIWMRHMSACDKSQCLLVLSTWFTSNKGFLSLPNDLEDIIPSFTLRGKANVLVIINAKISND